MPSELRVINDILNGQVFAFTYLDDICIASSSKDERKPLCTQLLERVNEFGTIVSTAEGKINSCISGTLLPESITVLSQYAQLLPSNPT